MPTTGDETGRAFRDIDLENKLLEEAHKIGLGAQSRSGYSRKLGFEGGQMPLQRRLPKFGFTNLKRVEFKAINLSTLEELAAKKSLTEVTVDTLIAAGFISSNDKVKILGNGTISKALAVKAHAFSKSAEAAITAAGGSVEKL